MNKYTLLVIVLAFYNSTALGQTYELEWEGQDGQSFKWNDAFQVGFYDFDNNEQPNIVFYTQDADDIRTVTGYDNISNIKFLSCRIRAFLPIKFSLSKT